MKKKIGILELCASQATNFSERIDFPVERKQFVSITPQAISVWCRQMGHEVHYATYYGNGDPKAKLPNDLDIVFISTFSYVAPLAYAVSKAYRMEGVRTVIGGPHAKAFPQDALRYFDLVVLECDKTLIEDILGERFPPHSIISSEKPFDDIPLIEERMPEIKTSSFWRGKPTIFSMIPMLASIGCPYSCDFCVDWDSTYRALPFERLAKDLQFASENLTGVRLGFCDPNFGLRFDETLDVFESIAPERRNPYIMETSLTNLRATDRLQRLKDTKCFGVLPGIESWTAYSNKVGVGKLVLEEKLSQVVEHLALIEEYIPYMQANFILGSETDAGDVPFELTKEFMHRAPFAFPGMFVPVAYGGTPFRRSLENQGRILTTLPFTFYFTPYLMLILKNYDALTYFERMADLYSVLVSPKLIRARMAAKTPRLVKGVNLYRSIMCRPILGTFQEMAHLLRTDPSYRVFHAGESPVLPGLYVGAYRRQLGKYAELMPIEESQPMLNPGVAPSFAPQSPVVCEQVAIPSFMPAAD